jgi:putative addiction module CopG family antidote
MSSSPSLNVSLTPQLQSFIAGLVASGRYQTASEAVGQHSGCWKV